MRDLDELLQLMDNCCRSMSNASCASCPFYRNNDCVALLLAEAKAHILLLRSMALVPRRPEDALPATRTVIFDEDGEKTEELISDPVFVFCQSGRIGAACWIEDPSTNYRFFTTADGAVFEDVGAWSDVPEYFKNFKKVIENKYL